MQDFNIQIKWESVDYDKNILYIINLTKITVVCMFKYNLLQQNYCFLSHIHNSDVQLLTGTNATCLQ